MSAEHVKPLSLGARAALTIEREVPDVSLEQKSAAYAKLAASLGAATMAGAAAGAGVQAGATAQAGVGAQVGATAIGKAALAGKIGAAVAVFALGAATGVTVDRAFVRAPAALISSAAPAVSSSLVDVPEVPAVLASTPAPVASTKPSAEPRAATPRRDRDRESTTTTDATSLNAERVLIDAAREAVARGRGDVALEALARHEREFPRGQLVEEREGLRVLGWARAGDLDRARTLAASFRRRYPKSVLLPAIDEAVASP